MYKLRILQIHIFVAMLKFKQIFPQPSSNFMQYLLYYICNCIILNEVTDILSQNAPFQYIISYTAQIQLS
jgi:hypothetical protein